MPIYLSEYIGSGQAGDLFRPRGSDQPGWAAIDLRPDGGATREGNGLNRCLLYLPTPDPDARLYQLASEKGEALPLAVRVGLAARLNATIAYTRLDDLIAELLLRPPARAWKPLRDRADRQLAIYLGGLLSPSPALRSLAAKIYRETWGVGDSGSLTADLTWSEAIGTGWQIVSQQARLVGNTGFGMAIAQHDTDTDDQVASMRLVTFTRDAAGQVNAALLGRIADADTTTNYQVIASVSPTWSTKALEKYVSGAGTDLGSVTGASFSLPEAMTLSMIDSAIGGSIGSSSFGPVTDTAITGKTRAGISGYSTHASNLIAVGDWSVRDYATGAPFTMRQSTLRGGDVLRGVAPAGGTVYPLAMDAGAYTLTGSALTLRAARRLVLGTGAIALTGTALALKLTKILAVAAGTYTLTGTALTLRVARRLVLGSGAFSQTGSALTLRVSRRLGLESGSYAVTGTAINLTKARILAVNAGTYALTGSALTLRVSRRVALDSGAVSVTGSVLTLRVVRRLTLGSGSYALTGTAINLTKARLLALTTGAYATTGTALTLRVARRLVLGSGSFSQTGSALTLRVARRLPCAGGSCLVSGSPVALRASRRIGLASGAVGMAGAVLGLSVARRLPLAPGSYVFTGGELGLLASTGQVLRNRIDVTALVAASLRRGVSMAAVLPRDAPMEARVVRDAAMAAHLDEEQIVRTRINRTVAV